jgi:PAP2 superfamily
MSLGSAGEAAAGASAQGIAHRLRWLGRLLAQSFIAQAILFIIPIAYLISNQIMFRSLGHVPRAPVIGLLAELLTVNLPIFIFCLVLLRIAQYALVEKPERPVLTLWNEAKELLSRPQWLILGLPLLIAMMTFNKAVFELKPEIPNVMPFSWDVALMQLDRTLHFGIDPWRILQPILGHDLITFAVNLAYNFWFLFLIGSWFWFGFSRASTEVRTRFFLSYMLAWWLGGGLLAVAFSSAGPAYYGLIGLSPDPYAPLMSYLHNVDTRLPLWMLDAQKLLWDGYDGKTQAIGISAFPSMHNASAVIFALAFGRISRRLGFWMWIYAAIIVIGSVHSGWHYAIDAYAGIAIGCGCWCIAGPIAHWHERLELIQRFNKALAQF